MIIIPTILSEYKKVFNSTRKLIILVCNYLKKDIIEISKCLSTWYKQKSASIS